jgi:hypothetical protein
LIQQPAAPTVLLGLGEAGIPADHPGIL